MLVLVAPLVGAWIEIICFFHGDLDRRVAPLVGAWIEIPFTVGGTRLALSLPSWERGLKYILNLIMRVKISRSPRGSVD